MKKRLIIGSSYIIVTLSSSFSPHPTFAQNDTHDRLIIGVDDLQDVDFRIAGKSYGERLVYSQYMGQLTMFAPGDSLEILPGIAESWTHNDNFSRWEFTLREGAKLHDGSPIDAKTVQYSYYANVLSQSLSWWSPLDNLSNTKEVLDQWYSLGFKYTVNITFPETDPNGNGRKVIFQLLNLDDFSREQLWYACWNFDYMLVPYGSHGDFDDSTEDCMSDIEAFNRKPISAGPYKVHEWANGSYILLERFDDWFGWNQSITGTFGNSYRFPQKDQVFKYLKFVDLTDSANLKNDLLAGDIDIILNQDYYEIDNTTHDVYTAINETQGYTTYFEATPERSDLILNIQGDWPTMFGGPGNFPLSEPWFRQAVSHAIDREKLVSSSYKGFAYVADSLFFDEAETHFSNLDTSSFYNFTQGWEVAAAILDSNGYTPLGFPEESDNRFGYGPYANETHIDGVEQSVGRHFWLITTECPTCEIRIESIQDDLQKIGIHVDISTFDDFGEFSGTVSGDPGYEFNQTCIDLGDPDPLFQGPQCDFAVWGNALFNYPHKSLTHFSHAYWYNFGDLSCGYSNNSLEVALAKISDDGEWGLHPWFKPPYLEGSPEVPFNISAISNDDPQYIEGCEEAGRIFSYDLPVIPLAWYAQVYALNDHVEDFFIAGGANDIWATAYWVVDPISSTSTPLSSIPIPTTSSTTTTDDIPFLNHFLLIFFCFIILVYRRKRS